MKCIDIKLKITKGNTVSEWKAEIEFSDYTSFESILKFQEDFKKLHNKAMNAVKNDLYFKMSVSQYNYCKENGISNYDRWESVNPEDQDEYGIYLKADEAYTESTRDMYLSKGKELMNDLAFTLR